jgi:hypothetical protein
LFAKIQFGNKVLKTKQTNKIHHVITMNIHHSLATFNANFLPSNKSGLQISKNTGWEWRE